MAQSKTKWKQSKVHDVTLPSGFEVKIELPDLATMIKGGQVPNELLDAATKIAAGQSLIAPEDRDDTEKSRELIKTISDFQAFLVAQTVKDPEVTKEEVANGDLPAEDVELLVNFALRKTDIDAIGHQLGGLETVDSFRQIRGLDDSLSNLLGT